MLGPFLVGVLLPISGIIGAFVLLAGSLIVAALNVAILGEETRGRILEEI